MVFISIMRHGVRTRQRNGGKVEFFSGLIKIYHLKTREKCSQRKFVLFVKCSYCKPTKGCERISTSSIVCQFLWTRWNIYNASCLFSILHGELFLQRMSHLFLIGLMSTKEVILWNALLPLYYVTKGLDLMAIINLWKNFMYLNY